MSRLRACGSLRKLDVAVWQERARGAASGAGRLENRGGEGWNCCVCRGGSGDCRVEVFKRCYTAHPHHVLVE